MTELRMITRCLSLRAFFLSLFFGLLYPNMGFSFLSKDATRNNAGEVIHRGPWGTTGPQGPIFKYEERRPRSSDEPSSEDAGKSLGLPLNADSQPPTFDEEQMTRLQGKMAQVLFSEVRSVAKKKVKSDSRRIRSVGARQTRGSQARAQKQLNQKQLVEKREKELTLFKALVNIQWTQILCQTLSGEDESALRGTMAPSERHCVVPVEILADQNRSHPSRFFSVSVLVRTCQLPKSKLATTKSEVPSEAEVTSLCFKPFGHVENHSSRSAQLAASGITREDSLKIVDLIAEDDRLEVTSQIGHRICGQSALPSEDGVARDGEGCPSGTDGMEVSGEWVDVDWKTTQCLEVRDESLEGSLLALRHGESVADSTGVCLVDFRLGQKHLLAVLVKNGERYTVSRISSTLAKEEQKSDLMILGKEKVNQLQGKFDANFLMEEDRKVVQPLLARAYCDHWNSETRGLPCEIGAESNSQPENGPQVEWKTLRCLSRTVQSLETGNSNQRNDRMGVCTVSVSGHLTNVNAVIDRDTTSPIGSEFHIEVLGHSSL